MLQTIIMVILSLLLFVGRGWTVDACPEKCRNASFLGTNFWTAVRNPTNTLTVSRNGLPLSPQPGGTTPNLPAVQGFGSQVFLVVRGTDMNQGVWANQWTGSSWTGWYNVNAGMTTNSPDMERL